MIQHNTTQKLTSILTATILLSSILTVGTIQQVFAPGPNPKPDTTVSIAFRTQDDTADLNPATDGDIVRIEGTAIETVSGNPVTSGKGEIQRGIHETGIVAGKDPTDVLATSCVEVNYWDSFAGNLDLTGNEFFAELDTTGLGGTSQVFRTHFIGGSEYNSSFDGCLQLVINAYAPCNGDLEITAIRASGEGAPAPGTGPYEWMYTIKVLACTNLTGVTAQGGNNGWTTFNFPDDAYADTGSVEVRKQNKKTAVLLWTIGDMNEGDDATLDITLRGSIKNGTPCDTILNLNGGWSATYGLVDDETVYKTDPHTDQVTITVTCPVI